MAVVRSCTRAPLVSAHCSLSPDDVFVCCVGPRVLGWVQLSVLTVCRLVHQLHVCLWQWSTQPLLHVPKWSEVELALPRRRVAMEFTVGHQDSRSSQFSV